MHKSQRFYLIMILIMEILLHNVYKPYLKGGFTRRAKAGDNNQQTADEVKTAIPRPFTRTM